MVGGKEQTPLYAHPYHVSLLKGAGCSQSNGRPSSIGGGAVECINEPNCFRDCFWRVCVCVVCVFVMCVFVMCVCCV